MMSKCKNSIARSFKAIGAALVTAGVLGAVPSVSLAAEFYEGKTVSVLVGFPPGGGASLVVQNFAPFWTKHTPGNPKFVVQNMPGASGSVAVNFLYEKGPKDGETILFSPSKIAGETLGAEGERAKHNEFEIIGLAYDKYMAYGRTNVGDGIEKAEDLASVESVKLAARSPQSTLDVSAQVALNMLGVNYDFVCCYRGTAPMGNAIQSGEAEMGFIASADYRANYENTIVAAGDAIPLFYMPALNSDRSVIENDPELPDMPSFSEVYKELKGAEPSGVEWDALKWLSLATPKMVVAAPGTNPQAVADLRAGFLAAQQDPEFIAAHQELFGLKWIYAAGDDAAAVFDSVKNGNPEAIEFIKANYFTP